MCHHPASASAGIAADDAQAGSGTGTVARACSASACNPEFVRWVINACESRISAVSAHSCSASRNAVERLAAGRAPA